MLTTEIKNAGRIFLRVFLFLMLFWIGLYFLDIKPAPLSECLLASLFLAGAGAAAGTPRQAPDTRPDRPDTAWQFFYLLLTSNKSVLIYTGGTLLLITLVVWRVTSGAVALEYSGESGLLIKLPGQTIYYEPVSPFGWQNTGIFLREGDEFSVSATGRISPGFLRDITGLQELNERVRNYEKLDADD